MLRPIGSVIHNAHVECVERIQLRDVCVCVEGCDHVTVHKIKDNILGVVIHSAEERDCSSQKRRCLLFLGPKFLFRWYSCQTQSGCHFCARLGQIICSQ